MDKSANQHYNEIESEIENEDGESDVESILSDDQNDPTFDIVDETRSAFKTLSIKKKSKARDLRNEDIEDDSVNVDELELDEKDKKSFEIVQNIIKAGQLVKLKVEQCKVYLRKYGLRLTGNKDTLMQRIKEHLEVLDGGGEKRYPVSSFVVNCKGDACTGDIVMFEQNVYDMFNIASRSATGPPCGTRTVAGRIVKESYGAVKQQHTFTIEVLWSKGEKPHPPLHPLLIKGRNLYRLKTLRQKWENEGDRQKALMEKHTRGYLARNDRENRMQEKEIRKNIRTARPLTKKEPNKNPTNQEPNKQQTRINSVNPLMQPQQLRPFQIRQNSIPPFHQPAPVMTTTWNPTREEANVVLPQASTNPYRSGAAETMPQQANVMLPQASTNPYRSGAAETMPQQANVMLPQASTNPYRTGDATYTQKIQHQQTKIRHHGSYRQPLTSMNHHFSSSMNMNDRAPNYLPRTYNNSYYSTHERPTQNQMQRQHCRYFAKGRCYHGDNCKFLHEIVQ